MEIKKHLIEAYGMKPVKYTKYNEVYECKDYVMIVNKITHQIKIKLKV